MHEGSVNEPMSEPSNDLNTALAEFGDTPAKRRYRARKAKGYTEQYKSTGPREHVRDVRGYSVDGDKKTPAYNRPADDWRPQSPCTMSMDKALREMEFPSRLAGAEWTVP